MNRSARTAETVSDVYLAADAERISPLDGAGRLHQDSEAKYRLFLLLTIVYCAAAQLSALRRLERSASASCCVPSARLNG